MVRVQSENLRKEFGSGDRTVVAVDSVDLTVEDGTFVTILGPSGCGKTTLLRMLAGLETPTSGSIYFDGEDVTDVSVQDRHIGMVFQNIALFPFKTVRENIEYGLKYTDVDRATRASRAEEMAEMLGIRELMENKPNQLSGGQRQRVALGRALVRDPKVFLLDEPMSDLDAELKVSLRTELKELHQEFQTTTLYVTHDQEEAMTLSEEVIVIKDGAIQQQSPPFEMFSEPNNTFVAQFIGSPNINFLDGRIRDGELVVDGFERTFPVESDRAASLQRALDDHDPTVGVRPSALEMVTDPSEAVMTISAGIYEQLGDETILHGQLEDGTDVRAMMPPRVTPNENDLVHFDVDASNIHLFDSVTGEAVAHGLSGPIETAGADEEPTVS